MKRLPSKKEKIIGALKENRYLSGLDTLILEFLAENTQLISFEAEETIIREGQQSLGLYFIDSGQVKIFKYSSSGREMIINVLGAGESFNEVPVFDQLENPGNVSAVVDSLIWLIDAEALRMVITKYPQAARQIIINLSQNLRMLVGKVAELTFYTVTTRLARLIGKLPSDQLSGSERLTQDDLAARIGTVREVVARSLKELENEGVIEVQRGKIKIIDKEKLNNRE